MIKILEKVKIDFLGSYTKKRDGKYFFRNLKFIIPIILTVVMAIGLTIRLQPRTVYNPYRGIIGAYTGLKTKIIINEIILSRKDFSGGTLSLGKNIPVIQPGKEDTIDSPFDLFRFVTYGASRGPYFKHTALRHLYPSRVFSEGATKTNAIGGKNILMGFATVPFDEFNKKGIKTSESSAYIMEPFMKNEGMKDLEGFPRMFVDGQERNIKFNDTCLFLRPNTDGMFASTGNKEFKYPIPKPSETLVLAAYAATNLRDRTGEWIVPELQEWISLQYQATQGIYIPPKEIKIKGKGLNSRFKCENPPVDMITVLWKNKKGESTPVSVPLCDWQGNLCFYGSLDPTQSIIIPYAQLYRMEDEELLLLAKGDVEITIGDIKEEVAQVRKNKNSRNKKSFYSDSPVASEAGYTDYITVTPRTVEIANRITAGSRTPKEAFGKIEEFYRTRAMPYISDGNEQQDKEVPKSTLVGMFDGGDCEDFGISSAGMVKSATQSPLNGLLVGLAFVNYKNKGEGHVIALIEGIHNQPITNTYPNHISIPIRDNRKVTLFYAESTAGLGYIMQPQKEGHLLRSAMVLLDDDTVGTISSLIQFEHEHSVQ